MWLPILLPIFVFCAVMALAIARNNGRNQYGWFCLGLLFGPLALVVGLLPSLEGAEEARPDRTFQLTESGEISLESETKQCPGCSNAIQFEARACSFCGTTFDPAEVERQTASYRAELKEKFEQGLKRCPECGKWDVHEAYIEDGSWDDWCPNCSKSLKAME
jgi:hypothetical protein